MQTSEEALAHDLGLVAAAHGWTPEEAAAYHSAEQIVGAVAERIADERPNLFVGSMLSEKPDGAPTIFVKGPADDFVLELIDSAGVAIVLADRQPYSFDELEERKLRVHDAIRAQGFDAVVTRASIARGGIIESTATLVAGLPTASDEILRGIPAGLRSSVELILTEEAVVVPEGAFGGMRLRRDGFNECTSGWTVQVVGSTTRGISGAAHCFYVDEVYHPGHGYHVAYEQAAHEGQWGDVEWYTTAYAEADDFYADASTIRDVSAVEPRASISVNEYICAYGRSSNNRDCLLRVRDVSVASGSVNRLVQMNGNTQISGDSGGGWSFDNRAYGAHFGNCGSYDCFSVAALFDEALGIFVPTN